MQFSPPRHPQGDDRIRIEFQRAIDKFSSARGIQLQIEDCKRGHPEDIAVVFAEFDGARDEAQPFFRFRFEVLRPALTYKLRAAIGGQSHRGGIVWIDGERLFDVTQCGSHAFRGEFVRQLLRAQKQIIRIEVCRRLMLQPLDLGELQLGFDGGNDARRELILKIEHVACCALEAVGPDVTRRMRRR
jgi:hypothetical protein